MNVVAARIGLVCVTAVCLISGCSRQVPTAHDVVDELVKSGFEAPNPQDTTTQECAVAGCDQSIVTDIFRVKSFPTTGRAELYAKDRGLHQVETIVVSFAPPIPLAEQDRYWAEIEKLVG